MSAVNICECAPALRGPGTCREAMTRFEQPCVDAAEVYTKLPVEHLFNVQG